MSWKKPLADLSKLTSEDFVKEVEKYVDWAEATEQLELVDIGSMENKSFHSVVIVTTENIIQLIYNKESLSTTVGTASKDACEYAVKTWKEKVVPSAKINSSSSQSTS